jgi:hypothetical protein
MTASAPGTPGRHRLAQWLAVATLATLAACTSAPPSRPPGPPTVTPPVGSMTRERWQLFCSAGLVGTLRERAAGTSAR